jgi:hypothetical protein
MGRNLCHDSFYDQHRGCRGTLGLGELVRGEGDPGVGSLAEVDFGGVGKYGVFVGGGAGGYCQSKGA